MTDTTVTDVAGIQRTPTGEIDNPVAQQGTTGQPTESKPTTTPSQTSEEGKTVLTEAKPQEGEKKPEGAEGEKKETPKTEGVPEKYEFKLPEGFTLDEKAAKSVDELFRGMKLSQEDAQKLVDFYGSQLKEVANAPAKAYSDLTNGWRKDSENHPDLRGKLGEGQEVNVRIARFLNGMNDPQLASDFRSLMDLTGAGNHQAFIRVLNYAAQRLTEGSHVSGNGPSTHGQSAGNKPAPTAAEAMWPNLANRSQ